jgi:predicted TIM-barrel fold metal-dependent hydrolase
MKTKYTGETVVKIDIYTHWWPRKAAQALLKKVKQGSDPVSIAYLERRETRTAVNDLDLRFRFMNRHPDVLHVLTISNPPVEAFVGPKDAAEISKMANDELAELVDKYPDRFVAAVAILPMNDIDLALKECDRAITKLGLKGIRLYTTIMGETLDSPRLRPLYEKMAKYNLPIWIHPTDPPPLSVGQESHLGWEYEISKAMITLASSWVFQDFPNIKFITHHLGAMIPFYAERIRGNFFAGNPDAFLNLYKFYNDTALYGNTPALMCGYAFFGADHILFGTDMPLGGKPAGNMQKTISAIEAMDIPHAEKNRIYLENAVSLLNLRV